MPSHFNPHNNKSLGLNPYLNLKRKALIFVFFKIRKQSLREIKELEQIQRSSKTVAWDSSIPEFVSILTPPYYIGSLRNMFYLQSI